MVETTPGIHRSINLEMLDKEEAAIIKKLSRNYWYVTRVEKVSLGGSDYRYALIKPTQDINRTFNIYREVLVVFSNYEKFEPRAFDVQDSLSIQELRLEEICSIIISRDGNVADTINKILKSNKESRILVPFTYDELKTEDLDNVFINKMRQEFFSRDLFGIQDALKADLYFFGRSELVQELVGKHESGESAGIFGLRKTGKTSILYGVSRNLARKKSNSVFIDCQTMHNKRWNLALSYLIQTVTKECGLPNKLTENNRVRYLDCAMASDAFYEDIQAILNHTKKGLLLIFDEIENIAPGTSATKEWKEGADFIKFWQSIRSAFQRNKTKHVFTYLIAGTNPRCVETPFIGDVDNPIFQQFTPIYIPQFTLTETREMIERLGGYMGLKFSEEVCTHIVEDFGGHPLLMRQMCSYIHRQLLGERKPVTISKTNYVSYKQQFYVDNTGFSTYASMILEVLTKWYNDEYQMLCWLAVDDVDNFKMFSQEGEFLRHLLNYGIIESDTTDLGYHFKIESFQQYLIEKNNYKRPALSDIEKEQEIQKRRSDIEKKLRKLVKRHLKGCLGEEKAKEEIIRQIYGEKGIGPKSNIAYQDFFDPNKHEIYLKTLINVIKRNYVHFGNLFAIKQEEFESKSTLLNLYRKADAHSAPITNADFEIFRGVATWFENILIDE